MGEVDFEDLLRRQRPGMRRHALARLGDAGLADDATQEALLRAWQLRHQLDPSPALLRSLADTAARNVWRRESRHRARRHDELAADEVCDPRTHGVEELVLARERTRVVAAAVRALAPRHRRVLALSHVGDASQQALADGEGLSYPAFISVLMRARRSFRDRYREAAEQAGLLSVLAPVSRLAGRLRRRMADLDPRWAALPMAVAIAGSLGTSLVGPRASAASHPAVQLASRAEEPLPPPTEPSRPDRAGHPPTEHPGPALAAAPAPSPPSSAPPQPEARSTAVGTQPDIDVTPDSYNGSMLWITVRCDAGRVAAAQCAVLGIARGAPPQANGPSDGTTAAVPKR
jgi:RNA polymerase sigma factor (sigma-70 family)